MISHVNYTKNGSQQNQQSFVNADEHTALVHAHFK